MKMKREDVRNVAIIAHVDHGKTTLVDQLLRQSGVFRANQEVVDRVMDSNDIERERGITILSKNTAVNYNGTKINIIDTPGHADFGGEVERVLKMVNGVILLVDAYEGAMPQTKFVLRKALELDLPVIVCINKIDRPEARPEEVVDEVLELLMDLDASDEQLDCPFLYASARSGYAKKNLDDPNVDMQPLFQTILDYIPAPEGDPDAETQVLISTIDYNEYVGRIGVGKIDNGSLRINQECVLVNHHDPDKFKKIKIGKLYEFDGLKRVEVQQAEIGSIVAISGIADIHIGDTICSPENPEAIHAYQQEFRRVLENSSQFFLQSDSPNRILNIFGSIMQTKISTNFALESHPCLALMSYGPGFIQSLFDNRDIDLSDPVYTQLAAVLNQTSFSFTEAAFSCNYFTLSGIRKFARTGLLDGPYSYHQTPLPKEERKKALKHLLDTDMGHEKCRILKPSVLPETGIHLEVLSDYSVFLCFLSEKDTFLCIYLKETSIGQALNDYLCSLSEEESVYTKKEARQILLGLLEQL